jgi:nitrogen fixation/metabolism regulation signal transduction histidine kinase
MRLLLVFLLMALAPALMVLFVGSDLIQQTVDRWFNVDVERILSSSQALGTALRESVTERTRSDARAIAREVESPRLLTEAGTGRLRRLGAARASATSTSDGADRGRSSGGDGPGCRHFRPLGEA